MADEAFALSPINARASLPSEADYEAIREAFMETSRGRWFLSEYARRNRNADTRKVLDAVARIEQAVAQRKDGGANLIESLGAIQALIGAARAEAAAALPPADALAGAANGARIIGEVARTLRECGADRRICDLLDAQVAVIEAGHRALGVGAMKQAVAAAFDTLSHGLSDLAGGARSEAAHPAPRAERPAEVVPLHPTPAAVDPILTPKAATEAVAVAPATEAIGETAAQAEPAEQAVLDMVALAMAAEAGAAAAPEAASDALSEPAAIDIPDLAIAPIEPIESVEPPAAAADAAASPPPVTPQSLGEAFLARTTPARPAPRPAGDAYAPFRRMSQAEKVAFFS